MKTEESINLKDPTKRLSAVEIANFYFKKGMKKMSSLLMRWWNEWFVIRLIGIESSFGSKAAM